MPININPPNLGPNERLVSLFIRHGQTQGNSKDVFRGDIDYSLDANGIQAAKKLNSLFTRVPVGDVYRSDSTRAEQTADHALEGTGLTASPTHDLNSWDTGFLAGKSKKDNMFQMDWFRDNPDTTIPGGTSLNAFRHRVQPRIKQIIAKGIKGSVPSVAFTHSSVIHELSHMVYGDPTYMKVKPGGVVGVFHDGQKLSLKALLKPGNQHDLHYGS